jgi:hypothetical protein
MQDDTSWSRVEAEVAASVAGLGGNERARVKVLTMLPSSERGERLRQQGALVLLRKLLHSPQVRTG